MKDLPHYYHASATAHDDLVRVTSPELSQLETAAPVEFGGPGHRWSPETLFTAAIANCFVLTFKAVARASNLRWAGMECDVETVLDKVDGKMQFTQATVKVRLTVDEAGDAERAGMLLQKAEANCLISNSLKTAIKLEPEILVAA
jgi:organic hydroperoxide reductase OsmC/OhrA